MSDEKLGKYELRGTLGRGAMGTVYDGWDPVIERRVAIKTVRFPDASDAEAQEELARFKREAQAAGRLHHPNIVGVFDYGETADFAYIVMEYVDGDTVKKIVDANERMTMPAIARLMSDVLAGLEYSHERGVIHRDIKPANIMLTKEGRAKIADFGIARIESSSMTQAGTVLGTPAYMSPEQFMGQVVDQRTDLYSAGVLLYQLLTGERPFEGSMTTIMHKVLNTVPPKPSEISVTSPTSFDPIVSRAMAKRPDDRFPNAGAFSEAIEAALASPPPQPAESVPERDPILDGDATMIAVKPRDPPKPETQTRIVPPPPEPTSVRPGSRTGLIAGIAVAVIAAASAGGYFLFGSKPSPLPPLSETARAPVPQAEHATANTPNLPPPLPPTTAPTAIAPPAISPTPSGPASSANPQLATAPNTTAPTTTPPPAPPSVAPSAPPPVPTLVPTPVAPIVTGMATPQTAPPPPKPTASEVRESLAPILANTSCSLVSTDVSADGRTVTAKGIAGAQAVDALKRDIEAAAPDSRIEWHVRSFAGPYCASLDAVRATPATLAVQPNRERLEDEALLTLQATLPDYPAYLTVDYLSSDGSVTHLVPTTPDVGDHSYPPRAYPARSRQIFGEPIPVKYKGLRVGPPFGTDMIVVVASSVPLIPARKVQADDQSGPYLAELQAAIEAARKRDGRVAATAFLLDIVPKK